MNALRSARLCLWLCLAVAVLPAQRGAAQEAVEEISLESLLDQQVSTASKYEQTVTNAPASVTILTAEDIQRYGATSVGDLLRSVRGFYLAHDYASTYVGTRGFGRMTDYNNRLLVLLNGHPLNERVYGAVFLDDGFPVDLHAVERVEVVRGPGSALYGTGAMFAVVNIVTKTPPGTEGLAVQADVGSFGYKRAALSVSRMLPGDLRVFATGLVSDLSGPDRYFMEFDTRATNYGVAEGMDWSRTYGAFTSAQYRGWSLQALYTYADHGIPTGDFGSIFNDDRAHFWRTRTALELKREQALGYSARLTTRGFFDASTLQLQYPFRTTAEEFGLDELDVLHILRGTTRSAGAETMLQWDLHTSNRLVLGAQYIYNYDVAVTSTSDVAVLNLTRTLFDDIFPYHMVSLYVQDEYQVLPNLSLTAGLRQDVYGRLGATTPRAAVVYHPAAGTTLKALYGEAFREPNGVELYYESPVERLASNPDLTPEKIRTSEFVWEQRLGARWTSTVSAYHYRIRDLIAAQWTPDSLSQFANLERVRATGLELELGGLIAPSLEAHASYSYQRARQVEPEKTLPNAPRYLVKGRASFSGLPFLRVAGEVFYESPRETPNGDPVASYWLADLNLSTSTLWDHWRLTMQVHNVLDADYCLPAAYARTVEGQQHDRKFRQDGRRLRLRLAYVL